MSISRKTNNNIENCFLTILDLLTSILFIQNHFFYPGLFIRFIWS